MADIPELPASMFSAPKMIAEDPACTDLVELMYIFESRLREEVRDLPLNTLQCMLLERVCSNYLILRHRERAGIGNPEGFEHTTAAKDFNSFWLASHRELNSQLKLNDKALVEGILRRVNNAVSKTLDTMHEDVAQPLRKKFADAFAGEGL